MPIRTPKKKRSNRKPLLLTTAIVVFVLVIIGGAYAWHQHNKPKQVVTKTSQPVTEKGTGKSSAASSTSTTSKGTSDTTTPPSTTTPSVKPAAPYGSFVSNHKPGQAGSPLEEASVCNTTPGVNCEIVFTKNGVTKSLGAKATDNSGAAYWSWTPQSTGLTSGNWVVSAVATSGSQSTSTQDPTVLEVQ